MGATIEINQPITEALKELRYDVEHINRFGSIGFRSKVLDDGLVSTITVDGFTFGYKLIDLDNGFMMREIMVRPSDGSGIGLHGYEEINRVIPPVFEAFFTEGYTDIDIRTIQGCLVFRQKFQISFLFERNPNIIVPGKVC
jgi:hypothetical protein